MDDEMYWGGERRAGDRLSLTAPTLPREKGVSGAAKEMNVAVRQLDNTPRVSPVPSCSTAGNCLIPTENEIQALFQSLRQVSTDVEKALQASHARRPPPHMDRTFVYGKRWCLSQEGQLPRIVRKRIAELGVEGVSRAGRDASAQRRTAQKNSKSTGDFVGDNLAQCSPKQRLAAKAERRAHFSGRAALAKLKRAALDAEAEKAIRKIELNRVYKQNAQRAFKWHALLVFFAAQRLFIAVRAIRLQREAEELQQNAAQREQALATLRRELPWRLRLWAKVRRRAATSHIIQFLRQRRYMTGIHKIYTTYKGAVLFCQRNYRKTVLRRDARILIWSEQWLRYEQQVEMEKRKKIKGKRPVVVRDLPLQNAVPNEMRSAILGKMFSEVIAEHQYQFTVHRAQMELHTRQLRQHAIISEQAKGSILEGVFKPPAPPVAARLRIMLPQETVIALVDSAHKQLEIEKQEKVRRNLGYDR